MPFFNFQDQNVYYSASQEGRPGSYALVLVHGAGGAHLQWPPELRRLPDTTVYAVDLPGHGKSSGPGRARVGEYAEAIRTLLDATGTAHGVVCGHSMGGAIAQTFALNYPDRTAGVVLVGTGARLRVAPQILQGLPADFAGTVGLIVDWAFGPQASETLTRLGRERMLETEPAVLLGDYEACNQFDVRDQLAQISAPALIICGSADKLTPEEYSHFLADQLPNAQRVALPDAGHMVMLERPAEVTDTIRNWLGSIDTPARLA